MRAFKKLLPALASVVLVVLMVAPAFAHHSFAMFDNLKKVALTGKVKEFQWVNPHCWVQLLVKDPATGNEVEWSLELSSPNILVRNGWNKYSLKAGDMAEVVIHPLRNGSTGGALVSASVNGRKIGTSDAASCTVGSGSKC